MKKLIFLFGAATLIAFTTYAQTQRTNRTKTRTHDRTEVVKDPHDSTKLDKASHEADMDRNNSKKPDNTPPKPAK